MISYLIFKIICNTKEYIGSEYSSLDSPYIGDNEALLKDIETHNYTKEYLYSTEKITKMELMKSLLLNKDYLNRSDVYNTIEELLILSPSVEDIKKGREKGKIGKRRYRGKGKSHCEYKFKYIECKYCGKKVRGGVLKLYHNENCLENPLNNGIRPPSAKKQCEFCGRFVGLSPYARFHGSKCKENPENAPKTEGTAINNITK